MRILVTGGAGFAGSHLALGLKSALAADVTALDNLHRLGSELNLPRLLLGGVNFIHGDIRNPEDLASAGPFDLLVECSAEPAVTAGYGESPRYVIDTNLLGTVNCLEAARTCGARACGARACGARTCGARNQKAGVIFLSTSRVYPLAPLNALRYHETETRFALDDKQGVPGASARGISEEFPLSGPRSMYGATKLASELLLQEYVSMYGLRGVVNRCGILTGPWQMGKTDQGVVTLWAGRHVYGGELAYIGYGGKGKQVRDMLHIGDLVQLVVHQVEHLDDLNGETFNVGGGPENAVSLLELTQICQKIAKKSIKIAENPQNRPADIPIYITDTTKVRRATGWRPRRDVESIVAEIVDWIEFNRETLRPVLA